MKLYRYSIAKNRIFSYNLIDQPDMVSNDKLKNEAILKSLNKLCVPLTDEVLDAFTQTNQT